MNLRAEEFAKSRGMKISWVVAKDVPLFHEDRSLPKEALHEKTEKVASKSRSKDGTHQWNATVGGRHASPAHRHHRQKATPL